MNPYAIKSVFTVREAALAICGIQSDKMNSENKLLFQLIYDELAIAIKYEKLRVKNEQTGYFPITGCESDYNYCYSLAMIQRDDLLHWCREKEISPPLLFPEPKAEKPLQENERQTLLKIIRMLAELHKVKPLPTRRDGDGWGKAVTNLLTECATKGITPAATDETLVKHFRTAFDFKDLEDF